MANIMRFGGGVGGGGELNVFVQETQPTAQNGLWIKRVKDEVSKVLIKSDYYLSDGVGENLPAHTETPRSQGTCAGIKIGNKIYILPLYVIAATGLIYDIDSGVFTNQPNAVTFPNNVNMWCTHDNKIYVRSYNNANHYITIQAYDPVANSVSSIANIYTSPYQEETYGMWVSEEYIFLAGGTVYDSHWYDRPVLYDRSTNVSTLITNTQHLAHARGAGYVFKRDARLYFVGYCTLAYSYDLQTGKFEFIYKHLYPPNNPGYISYSPNTFFYALGKLYLIGVKQPTSPPISWYGKSKDVVVYDLVSDQITLLENVISEDAARSFQYFGGIDFQGTLQAGFYGGFVQDSSSASKVYQYKIMVFNIQTNEFSNGTVVCQPSVNENVTEMYSDKLSTLDFGVSEVYYKSASGFSKQDAAIIKDGVVTNIGGGVTPEPTPTPTLEGTWVLNDTLVAPESAVYFNNQQFKIGDASNPNRGTGINLSCTTSKIWYTSYPSGYDVTVYTFSTNSWGSDKLNYFTFPSGATASDDFITWLAANATKQ